MKKNKTVYVPLAIDYIKDAHIKIIKEASRYGNVVVGLLTDNAISKYKTLPLINYESRELLVKNLRYVSKVIPDDSYDYTKNLEKLKPEYFIHGDDWKTQIYRKDVRLKVIKTLKKWSGKLIEPKSTPEKNINNVFHNNLNYENVESRVSRLKRLISNKNITRILESHNSLTGLIIENVKLEKKIRL